MRQKSSDSVEIWYTTAYLEFDDSHVNMKFKKTSVSETIRQAPLAEAQTALGNKNTFWATSVSVPLQKFCEKLLLRTKFP